MIVDVIYEGIHYDKYKFNLKTNELISYCCKQPKIKESHINSTQRSDGTFYSRKYYSFFKIGKGKKIAEHRLVYQLNNLSEDIVGKEIDHIDRNPLNNDICNLRSVTNCQNQANKNKCVKPTTSKYIGISYCKRDGREPRWDSSINVETNRYRKFFKSEFEALKWRNNKIIELGVQEYYEIQPWIKKQVVIKKKN